MSDYIYSTKRDDALAHHLHYIYSKEIPTQEWHGEWGTLAATENIYSGFQPYETEQHIAVVVGGPILKFTSNEFIKANSTKTKGTELILARWLNDQLKPEDDLSGPFSIIIICKETKRITVITDLMSFIPTWSTINSENEIALSTHVDSLALSKGLTLKELDNISAIDFLLNGTVTYPYSLYKNIRQISPASYYIIKSGKLKPPESKAIEYYQFDNQKKRGSIQKTGTKIKRHVEAYIQEVSKYADNTGLFLSGGEDSRLVLSLIENRNRNAYIILDRMNREGRIAKKIASIYGAKFHMIQRDDSSYLTILPAASRLVGSGGQYIHAHTYNYSMKAELNKHEAVFGGFAADRLLKGEHIAKTRLSKTFPFLPQIKSNNGNKSKTISTFLTEECGIQLSARQEAHRATVRKFRDDESHNEWTRIWPSSMAVGAPNTHANRRLFRSYEPFFDCEIVKLSATIPDKHKLNRRVYHAAVKSQFKRSKWVPHSTGWYPYFSKWTNIFLHTPYFLYARVKRFLRPDINDGPWGNWNKMQKSDLWTELTKRCVSSKELAELLRGINFPESFESFSRTQKINAFQLLSLVEDMTHEERNRGA